MITDTVGAVTGKRLLSAVAGSMARPDTIDGFPLPSVFKRVLGSFAADPAKITALPWQARPWPYGYPPRGSYC
jgi:hypothetical protein